MIKESEAAALQKKAPELGDIIPSFINQPEIRNEKMVFVGTWKQVSSGYELIGRSWQCSLCGKVTDGAQCTCNLW